LRPLYHGANELRNNKWSDGVVNNYDLRFVGRDNLKRPADAILAFGPARYDAYHLANSEARNESENFGRQAGLHGQDDLIDQIAAFEASQCVDQYGNAADLYHLLGTIGSHPRANTGGSNNGNVVFAHGHDEAVWRG
jgi:hypothetical protein